MSLKGKASDRSAVSDIPAGSYNGVCVAVIDLGIHEEKYMDNPERDVRKVFVVFELAVGKEHKFIGKGFSIVIDELGGLVMGKKNQLRKMMESWRGKAYSDSETIDLQPIVGRACMVTIQSNKSNYPEIVSVSKPMDGVVPLATTVTTLYYESDSGDPAPNQAWLPFLFGKSVAEWLGEAKEAGDGDGNTKPETKQEEDQIPF
jgi:hypothetical protein